MDALECLHTRRSIRQYTEEPVSDADIGTILDAAMIAPSAGNAQPWHFIVVRNKEVLQKLSTVHPYVGMAARAPLGVVVCANIDEGKYEGLWVQDCSAATQNLLLGAQAVGLGSVWTAVYPFEDRVGALKEIFGLPEKVIPFSLVLLGYGKDKQERKSRYNAAKVHQEKW